MSTGAGVSFDFNPFRDKPPGPVGIRAGRTPESVARQLRAWYMSKFSNAFIPLTLQETYTHRVEMNGMIKTRVNVYEFMLLVAMGAGCSMDEAQEATEKLVPELFAGYWMKQEEAI